jgi:hypothetical protein
MTSVSPKAALRRVLDGLRPVLAPVLRSRWMWLEVVVITACALGLGLLFHRDNPFQVRGEFPWLWLAPLLLALRYGVGPGIFSVLMLVAGWEVLNHAHKDSFPEQYFLGGLILVMLSGEFSGAWNSRLRRTEEARHYLDERLRKITVRHLLLRLSHEHLEQEILTKPVTLRDALRELRRLTTAQEDADMPASHSLLQLLAQYCQLESAAIFLSPLRGGYVRSSAIGSPPQLHASDPLLQHALMHQSLSHLLTDGLAEGSLPSPFLVVAPIMASDGQTLGVLCVDRMPFLALNQENLQMLTVLLGYYADCVVESEGTRQFFKHFPDAPADFAAEFSKMLRLQRNYGIESHVIVLSLGSGGAWHGITEHELIRRSLDIPWRMNVRGRVMLATLMPLTSDTAIQEYLLRIGDRLKGYLGPGYDERGVTPHVISLSESDPVASLARITQGERS